MKMTKVTKDVQAEEAIKVQDKNVRE